MTFPGQQPQQPGGFGPSPYRGQPGTPVGGPSFPSQGAPGPHLPVSSPYPSGSPFGAPVPSSGPQPPPNPYIASAPNPDGSLPPRPYSQPSAPGFGQLQNTFPAGGFPGSAPQPGPGYGYNPLGASPAGSPTKSTKALLIGLIAGGLALALIMMAAGIILFATLQRKPGPTVVTPTVFAPTSDPMTTDPTPLPTETSPTTTIPTPSASTKSPSPSSGFNPPVFTPPPGTPPVDDPKLLNNPLYAYDVPTINCGDRGPAATQAEFEGRVAAVLDCVNSAWLPILAEVGISHVKPTIVHYTGSISSPCGTVSWYAYYCRNTIYFNQQGLSETKSFDLWIAQTVTHEFVHHLQNESGMAPGVIQVQQIEGQPGAQRRFELQAACMQIQETMKMTGVKFTDTDMKNAYNWYVGDSQHGTTDNMRIWMLVGWRNPKIGACNTWAVDKQYTA